MTPDEDLTLLMVQQQRDQALANARGWMQASEEWQATAEEWERRANKAKRALATAQFEAATLRADRDAAEEERDEERAKAYNWEATAAEWEKRAVRAEHTATDEMVQRIRDAALDEGLLIGSSVARRLLVAALTEPTDARRDEDQS